MSILLKLKTVAAVISGSALRQLHIDDAITIETEANRIAAKVDPVISDLGALTLGGVERSTWPAASGAAASLDDIFANGSVGKLSAAATAFTIKNTDGSITLFTIDKATGNAVVYGTLAAASATITGDVAAASATITGAITSGPATLPGHLVNITTADSRYAELLEKTNTRAVCFTKTAAQTISVLAGTSAKVAGLKISFAADTAVTMPALNAGTDYAVYICTDGSIRADANFSAPSGYTTNNSLQVGGFHYGLVGPTETVAGGSFATTGTGMIWTQADVDKIRGINQWSLWDLKFRPVCDPRGMVLVDGRTWVDIYFCNTDPAANGTSKYNTNIASGTVPPKIPAAFGGNGTATYASPTWWDFNEVAHAYGKRMMYEHEFITGAYGVTENQSIGGAASTYPTTLRNAGYTSKYGIEEATGHHWSWGLDSGGSNPSTWIANGGRGQSYMTNTTRVILGGGRVDAANSGSRCSVWTNGPGVVVWYIGLRAACDHVQPV